MDQEIIKKEEEAAVVIPVANGKFVTARELNVVLGEVEERNDQLIDILFKNEIDRIDIMFIAGLYLLYKDRKLRFRLSQEGVKKGIVLGGDNSFFELKNYLGHLDFLYGETDPNWFTSIKHSKSDAKAAHVYSPILFIDKDTLGCLFNGGNNTPFEELKTRFIQSLDKDLNTIAIDYFSETPEGHILNRLYFHAPVYAFVFSVLYEIESPFVKNEGKDKLAVAIERINRTWSFTVKYVSALKELAKNIVQHSNTKQGVISIRAYRPDENTDTERIVETYVIDYGTVGIVPTMIQEMKAECDKDLPAEEDLADLGILVDNYSLKKFFTPGKSERLSRQFRREMAHLGLLHFMSLIHSYNGSSWISTQAAGDPPRETYGDEILKDASLDVGTNFHFSLPLSRHFSDSGGLINPPPSTTREAIAAMPHIYDLIDQIKPILLNQNISYVGTRFNVEDRDAERMLVDSIPFEKLDTQYIVLDFESIEFSPTSLLRVFAMISERTEKPVIAMNISTEVLSQMIDSNEKYFKTMDEVERVPFWIHDRAILIYSKLEGSDFYFADILFGNSPEAFFSINKMVNNCFPNFATIASDVVHEITDDHSKDPEVAGYFEQSTLLPFDMILTDRDDTDLFSHNLMTLVNKILI